MARRRLFPALMVLLGVGCGPLVTDLDPSGSDDSGDEPPATGGATSGPTTTTSPPVPPSTSTTTVGPSTTVDPDGGTEVPPDPSVGFLDDGGDWGPTSCDPWLQDCPRGEKCMPWANDGGSEWNDWVCRPIEADPAAPGDPCTVEGSGLSGFDTCELGAMCWDVDPSTLTGTCAAQCVGTPDNPQCNDPSTICFIGWDDVIALCVPVCDPLLQDCPVGQGCYSGGQWEDPVCLPEAEVPAVEGEPCDLSGDCIAGTLCADASMVPGCTGSSCCTNWCDLSNPEPQCLRGQTCVPYWDPDGWPTFPDLGACGVAP